MVETKYEREKRLRSLFTAPLNSYGYQLNAGNPVIRACHEDRFPACYRPEGDKERVSFEKALWNFFRWLYKRYDPKLAKDIPPLPEDGRHISEILFGWRYEWFQIFINDTLDIQKTVKLFRKVEFEGSKYGKVKESEKITENTNQNIESADQNAVNADQIRILTEQVAILTAAVTAALSPEPKEKKPKPAKKSVPKKKYGEYKHVMLSDEEYTRLVSDFGESTVKEYIRRVDEYVQGNRGKPYKDYNLTIRRFIRGDREKAQSNKPAENEHSYNFNLMIEHAMYTTPKIK